MWHQCWFCFGVSHLAETDCFTDVSKIKPANLTRWKTVQTRLTSTTSHWDSLRIFSLVKHQYFNRHAAKQLEWPSANWTLQYQLNHAFHFISLLYLLISLLPTMRTDYQQYGLIQEENSIFWEVTYRSLWEETFMWMCVFLNGYRDWCISNSKLNFVWFLFVDLDATRSLQQKDN